MASSQKILAEAIQRKIAVQPPIAAVNNFAAGIVEIVGVDATPLNGSVIAAATHMQNGISPFFTQIAGNPYRSYFVVPSTATNGDDVRIRIGGHEYTASLLNGAAGGDGSAGIKYDGDIIDQTIPGADLVSGAGDELGGPDVQADVPGLQDGQRFLAVYEYNAGSRGKLFALSSNNATGVPIPAFRTVTAVPAVGQLPGEAVLNTTNGTSWIWDGARWDPVVPPSIIPYPTDADVFADNAAALGTYAFSKATGNLFVRFNDGAADMWRQIGIRHFTDVVELQGAAGVVDGSYAYVQLGNTFWVHKNGRWQVASTIIDTEALLLGLDPAIHSGGIGIAIDTGKLYVSDGAQWLGQPFRDYATEADLLAATPPDGTMAVAVDTGLVYYYPDGLTGWVSVNKNAIPTGTTDPAAGTSTAGDLFYNSAEGAAKVFNGTSWTVLGIDKLENLTDTDFATAPADGDLLVFDGASGTWKPTANPPAVVVGASPASPQDGALWFDGARLWIFYATANTWIEC